MKSFDCLLLLIVCCYRNNLFCVTDGDNKQEPNVIYNIYINKDNEL
jgi:hypothetical protein